MLTDICEQVSFSSIYCFKEKECGNTPV